MEINYVAWDDSKGFSQLISLSDMNWDKDVMKYCNKEGLILLGRQHDVIHIMKEFIERFRDD